MMTSNNSKVDHDGTTEDIEDDEFDDLFNFTSPSNITAGATNVVPARASSPIQFGLDSDSSDSEVDDSAPPTTNSKNNVSLESSSYYEVSSSTGTSTPSTDGPKENDTLIAGNVNSLLGDTGVTSGLALERQGEDDFQELDEGTRDFLDWLDKPKPSTTEAADRTEKDPERSSNDDDLDFVDIHMPDKVNEREEEDASNRSKETLILLGEEEQTSANLPTIATIPQKDESTQILSPEPLIPVASTDSGTVPALHQINSILTESSCIDVEDFKVLSNVAIEGDAEEIDEDSSEGESDIEDLFLTEENEEVEEDLTFTNLSEAIRSTQSSVHKHILPFLKSKDKVSIEDRPWLWTKAICGKILSDVKSSSLADSFVSWDKSFNLTDLEQKDNLWKFGVDEKFAKRLLKEVDCLADRIVASKRENTREAKNKSKRDLSSLLLFYYHSGTTSKLSSTSQKKTNKGATSEETKNSEYGDMEEVIDNTVEDKDSQTLKQDRSAEASKTSIEAVEWNSLIGPIAATLLSSSVCAPVASVMLSTIIPVAMPLVSLTTAERLDAAKKIHFAFYLLVCYHLPMLVLHLDRYCPGWHWPKLDVTEQHAEDQEGKAPHSPTMKGRNLGAQGIIPMTWFTSQLAGECTADGTRTTTELKPDQLLHLWDIMLTSNDHSLPFFLALRILEKHSYKLLMLRGEDLTNELTTVLCFQETTTAVESFMGYDETATDDISPLDTNSVVDVWWDHAVSMRESTPVSVVSDLQKAEDNAISLAFQLRHIKAMNNMKLRFKQEAEEHMAAIEEKRCMREEEVQYEFYKTRLQKFYKKHCPDRIDKVDSVLKVYEGRYQLLNDRLSKKYGSGFIPIFSPKLSIKTNNLMSTMGHGIRGKRKEYMATMVEKKTMELFGDVGLKQAGPKHQVAVNVETGEILPSFVTKKNTQDCLKYYLVDSRPEEMATLQGRFPTSVRLSPDDLMDPDRMQQKIDMFEALRGAVHICIMGEGFSSFPSLYSHPLSKKEERLLDDDETRTNMCALFFIKRGFPFVSILDGGFAAAHAWLARDCTHTSISSVLVDYDEELSLFAQLERSYRNQVEFANASTREKTTLVVQELIDRSMSRLTISENKMELFAETLRTEAGRKEVKESVSKILIRSAHQIKKGVNQVKRSNSGEEADKVIAQHHSIEESKKDAVSGEGMTFKMRFAELRERSKDRVPKNTNTAITGNEKDDTRGDSASPKEKEGRTFKNLKLNFGGMAKANVNPVQTNLKGDASDKQTSSVNPVKRGLNFLSQRETRNIDGDANTESKGALSKGHEPVMSPPVINPPKKNFGSEVISLKKGFEFKKISLPRFNKQQSNIPVKDALSSEPSKPAASKFKRNLFAKKVAKSDNDLDKAIAAALEGKEKSSDPKPGPLREKIVGFTKSASMGIKVAAMSTPQIKRPVLSFNKLGSVDVTQPRKHMAEEELISFEDIGVKSSVEKSDSLKFEVPEKDTN